MALAMRTKALAQLFDLLFAGAGFLSSLLARSRQLLETSAFGGDTGGGEPSAAVLLARIQRLLTDHFDVPR